MNNDAFLDEMIAEAAKTQGVVVKRDDPIMAAVLLNKAILERYLHQAIAPIQEAIAGAVTRAKKEVSAHAQDQASYVEQTMLKDREKFVTEQKAALDALDERLLDRDAGIVKVMTDILEKARANFSEEMTQTVKEHTKQVAYKPDQRPKKAKNWAALGTLGLGLVVGSMGTMATIIILLRLGVVGVVGGGQ